MRWTLSDLDEQAAASGKWLRPPTPHTELRAKIGVG
jgi:hypothetical protein